jgi:hypothetical protein
MASRKRTVCRTEEALADAVKEIVNDSDSGTDNIPEFSSSEESKTVKWPKKIFFYLLQCCLFNS